MTPDERDVFDRQLVKYGFWIGWICRLAEAWYRWPLAARVAVWVLLMAGLASYYFFS